ncbi:hypothetical protein [Endothiovibrio diazotrophicus]
MIDRRWARYGRAWGMAAALLPLGATAGEQCLAMQKTVLREAPRYVAAAVAEVTRPARLKVESTEAGWAKVSVGGHSGWIHGGVLVDCAAAGGSAPQQASGGSRAAPAANPLGGLFGGLPGLGTSGGTSGGDGAGYSRDEITLAGKGFDEEGERALAAGGKYDFAAVDWLEKRAVSDKAVRKFADQGKLVARAYQAPKEAGLADQTKDAVGGVLDDLGGLFK